MSGELVAALAAEEAAIYAYGLVGVRLTVPAEQGQARAADTAHRLRRDYLIDQLDQLKALASSAPAGYQLPFAVTDRPTALKLAIWVEDGVAQAWRATLPTTEPGQRSQPLAYLIDSALRATRWRQLAGITPATLAFPGRP